MCAKSLVCVGTIGVIAHAIEVVPNEDLLFM